MASRPPTAQQPLKILVGGAFARVPGQGGLVWMVLQYVLGLRRLGHEVLLLEPLAASDLLPAGSSLAASANAAYFRRVVGDFGLGGAAALVLADSDQTVGVGWDCLRSRAAEADLVVDIAGGLAGFSFLEGVPARLYLDVDPGFTQLWHAVEGIDMRFAGHTHFATVGLTFETSEPPVPRCGIDWIATPPPVVLDEWPFANGLERESLTTVANWRGYGSIEANGRLYGQKAHSVRRFIDLPRRAGPRFELALAIHPEEFSDLEALAANGWRLTDPRSVSGSPAAYRRYVQGSRGELGIAKSGYVEARCGWFSDRSVCYLASGRPVIAQETGFSDALPVGAGLFAFETAEDVEEALEELARDYEGQRRAARAVAEEHFGSDGVLRRLLERVEVTR